MSEKEVLEVKSRLIGLFNKVKGYVGREDSTVEDFRVGKVRWVDYERGSQEEHDAFLLVPDFYRQEPALAAEDGLVFQKWMLSESDAWLKQQIVDNLIQLELQSCTKEDIIERRYWLNETFWDDGNVPYASHFYREAVREAFEAVSGGLVLTRREDAAGEVHLREDRYK